MLGNLNVIVSRRASPDADVTKILKNLLDTYPIEGRTAALYLLLDDAERLIIPIGFAQLFRALDMKRRLIDSQA
jgi:hypothetical protein